VWRLYPFAFRAAKSKRRTVRLVFPYARDTAIRLSVARFINARPSVDGSLRRACNSEAALSHQCARLPTVAPVDYNPFIRRASHGVAAPCVNARASVDD